MKFKLLIPILLLSLLLASCKKDEPVAPATVITFEAQTFEVLETITDADEIGQVVATSNMSDPITFRIIENSDDLFTITESGGSGLATGRRLNFKTAASHQIIVEATDGKETATATITINVINVPEPFITTWKTDNTGISNANQIIVYTVDGETYDYTIDWGDGSEDTNVTGPITHTYAAQGTYSISIVGTFPGIFNNGTTDANKLISVEQWGDNEWKTMASSFWRCSNLTINATDAPDLTQVTSMHRMFSGTTFTSADFSNWDVSSITDMSSLFGGAESFNGNISSWNVSNVTNMSAMFYEAEAFNGDISNWDVSNVTNMEEMLRGALVFNQDLNNWNVSNVTNMAHLFRSARAFDGDITSWDVSSVTDMSYMFLDARAFGRAIGNWDVSSVTNMELMFPGTSSNIDISNWDVSSVTNMGNMFTETAFNLNLGSWDVSNVTVMDGMISETLFTRANYDALLTGWSTLTLQPNVNFFVGNAMQYSSSSQAARDILTNTFGWTITDGGVAP